MIDSLLRIEESATNIGSHGLIPKIFNITATSPEAAFSEWIGAILGLVMTLGALMLLLYLIWGAFEWITSGGDKGKVEAARNKITQAVIGIIILATTVAIFVFIQNLLGISVLTFS